MLQVKRETEEPGTPGKDGAAPLSGVDRRGALQLAIEKKKLNIVKVLLQYMPGQRKVNNASMVLHLSALSATMLSQLDLLSLYRTEERIFQVKPPRDRHATTTWPPRDRHVTASRPPRDRHVITT